MLIIKLENLKVTLQSLMDWAKRNNNNAIGSLQAYSQDFFLQCFMFSLYFTSDVDVVPLFIYYGQLIV